jgi:hypothetical protein
VYHIPPSLLPFPTLCDYISYTKLNWHYFLCHPWLPTETQILLITCYVFVLVYVAQSGRRIYTETIPWYGVSICLGH